MAGKTGTAQAAQRPRKEVLELLHGDAQATNRLVGWLQNDHAWFVGYAPADEPDITVAVFIEHGGSGGHNAAPIARQVVDAWFKAHKPKLAPAETTATPRRARAEKPDPAAEDATAEVPVRDPALSPSVPDEDADDPPELPPGRTDPREETADPPRVEGVAP
jgi:penicillin-binding protein 2